MNSQQDLDSSSRVSMAKLTNREMPEEAITATIRKALAPLGGLEQYIHGGSKVLLKPNQTLFKSAMKGVTTSPRIIQSLIKICFELGAAEVWVAEAAGHGQQTRMVMKETGMAQAIKETKADIIYLDEVSHGIYDFGEDAGDLRYMPAPDIMERADVIINVPKAKTHFIDPISGACKNWVGVIPMNYRLHLQKDGDPYYRANALFLKKFKPTLNILDGLIAGEGQGPGGNSPFWWGWIAASTDPVAMDVTICQLFGLDWNQCRMVKEAAELGVGVYDPNRIELIGTTIEEARVPVKAADQSIYRYPARVYVGKHSTMEGSLGHWKTIADSWLDAGVWNLFKTKGAATFLFDDAEDPDFEVHVKEGPYIVLGDKAKDQYKYDPRVVYVPGDPVPQTYIQHEMIEGMGVGPIYEPGLRLYEMGSSLVGRLGGVSGSQVQKKTWAKVLGMAALSVGIPFALRTMRKRHD